MKPFNQIAPVNYFDRSSPIVGVKGWKTLLTTLFLTLCLTHRKLIISRFHPPLKVRLLSKCQFVRVWWRIHRIDITKDFFFKNNLSRNRILWSKFERLSFTISLKNDWDFEQNEAVTPVWILSLFLKILWNKVFKHLRWLLFRLVKSPPKRLYLWCVLLFYVQPSWHVLDLRDLRFMAFVDLFELGLYGRHLFCPSRPVDSGHVGYVYF